MSFCPIHMTHEENPGSLTSAQNETRGIPRATFFQHCILGAAVFDADANRWVAIPFKSVEVGSQDNERLLSGGALRLVTYNVWLIVQSVL